MNVDQESLLRLSRRRSTQIMMNIHKALVFVGFLSNANAYDVERAPPLREHSFSKPFQGKLLQKVFHHFRYLWMDEPFHFKYKTSLQDQDSVFLIGIF